MELTELRDRIVGALSAITGEDCKKQSMVPNLNEVLKVFAKGVGTAHVKITTPDDVIIATLNDGPSVYFGPTKIPPPSFWKRIKMDKQSAWNTSHRSKPWDGYTKSSDLSQSEKEKMSRIFSNFQSQYGVKQNRSEPSIVDTKVERYKGYAEADLVRIEQYTHELHDQWIMRVQAEELGLPYHDPVKWLEKRSNVSRETFCG